MSSVGGYGFTPVQTQILHAQQQSVESGLYTYNHHDQGRRSIYAVNKDVIAYQDLTGDVLRGNLHPDLIYRDGSSKRFDQPSADANIAKPAAQPKRTTKPLHYVA